MSVAEVFAKIKNRPKTTFWIGLILLAITFIGLVTLQSPSHDRAWQSELRTLPEVSLGPKLFRIKSIRDWSYSADAVQTEDYRTAAFLYSDLKQVWFVSEPFESSDLIAHTFLLFEFADQQMLGLSVEARREVGEDKYSALKGLFNSYELIYVWGTAKDFLTRRGFYLDHDIRMYPLKLSETEEKELLKNLLTVTKDLQSKPRFYNTFFHNCTSELAQSAGLPWDKAQILTGLSAQYLQGQGLIEAEDIGTDAQIKDRIIDLKDLSTGEFSRQLLLQLER